LEKWNIKRADVVNQIMNSADLVQEVNKFAYELQTGKIKVEKKRGGVSAHPAGPESIKGEIQCLIFNGIAPILNM
jgi:hypothetical protein